MSVTKCHECKKCHECNKFCKYSLRLCDIYISTNVVANISDLMVISKSGMNDVDAGYRGRPYGGVALVYKQHSILVYSEIKTNHDRIVALKVCDISGRAVQIIICVYMPFYQRGNSQQTENVVDTMDALQALIDEHGAVAPIKIVGDLNVQLPQKLSLVPGWHTTRGFNKHSSIMYDFITSNDFIVADFIHKQSINYTYFCDGTGVQTWIDHCRHRPMMHRRLRPVRYYLMMKVMSVTIYLF